jgi:hypothetical protein
MHLPTCRIELCGEKEAVASPGCSHVIQDVVTTKPKQKENMQRAALPDCVIIVSYSQRPTFATGDELSQSD